LNLNLSEIIVLGELLVFQTPKNAMLTLWSYRVLVAKAQAPWACESN
jgi:hypothetical protein